MKLAIILSLISVISMFAAIEFIVNYNQLPYSYVQKSETETETKPKQPNFDKIDRVNSDIQVTQLTE